MEELEDPVTIKEDKNKVMIENPKNKGMQDLTTALKDGDGYFSKKNRIQRQTKRRAEREQNRCGKLSGCQRGKNSGGRR